LLYIFKDNWKKRSPGAEARPAPRFVYIYIYYIYLYIIMRMMIIVGYCCLRRATHMYSWYGCILLPCIFYHTKGEEEEERGEYNLTTAHFVSRPFLVLMVMIFNHPFLSLSPPPLSIHPSLIAVHAPPLLIPGRFFTGMKYTAAKKSFFFFFHSRKNISIKNTATHPVVVVAVVVVVVVGVCIKAGETAIISPQLPNSLSSSR
jgi:hypothetical protein